MNIEEFEYDSENETDSEVDSDVEPENMKRLIQQNNNGYGTSERIFHTLPPLQTTTINSELSAEQAQLRLALSENKILDETLMKLEIIMNNRLNECRRRLNEIQSSYRVRKEKNENFRYISCGRPYFKDKQNFPAPDNDDAKMAKTQMCDFSMLKSAPGWTVKDKSQLATVVHKISIDLRKNELFAKIENLKRNVKSTQKLEAEIMVIRNEVDKVNKLPINDVALPIDQEYDWDLVASKLNGRHTAKEYQALWKLFLHPTINKNTWSKAEHAKLTQIACKYRMQDWDAIARKLNTGRTGYQCFVYHKTNMINPHIGKKWTDEEVIYLTRLIAHFKEGTFIPWGKIAAAMDNRTKTQIYNKYTRLIEQRKGRFLPEEDAVILNCVQRFGTNFKRMVNYLPGRSMSQIRSRHQVLSKLRVSTVWSVEDDKKLIQLMGHQESNMNFSTATQYFPGRNRTKIRTRYITLMKWMKKHPNLDLEHAPRRGARRLNHGRPSENLDEALENLKNSLVTTVQTKAKKTRLTERSTHTDIDDAIAVFFVNSLSKETEEAKERAPDKHLVLGPNHIVLKSDLNITNLRKNIIFLNASLNESTYLKSKYFIDYPNLGDNTQDVPLVKLKSYSRKNSSHTPVLDRDTPNVWGKPSLFEGTKRMCQRKYVLPPQLFTITGIKAIMEHVEENGQYSGTINVQVLGRRNSFLKDQLDKTQERFYILFTWPMILTSEPPTKSTVRSEPPRTDSIFIRPPKLPTAPEVTINVKCYKKFKNVDVSENIDLNENEAKKPKIAVEGNMGETNGENIKTFVCD